MIILVGWQMDTKASDNELIELKKMHVTGSHISRSDIEGVAPVAIFDREDLERSGATTINEFIRNMVYSSSGIIDEQFTQGFAPGTSGIDLRGLGVNRTLVLLDGRRLPVYPYPQEIVGYEGSRSFVDINSIPLSAIERIEVLKDGASAIYGADAVAGVVNLITRKDMDGAEAAVQFGMTSEGDGEEGKLSIVAGKQWEKTRATVVVDYLDREDIMAKDREISSSAVYESVDNRSINSRPGNYFIPYPVTDTERCPEQNLLLLGGPAAVCLYEFADWMTLVPETERLGLLGNLDHDLGDGLRLFGRAVYSYSYSESQFAPANTDYPDRPLIVSADNPTNPVSQDIGVYYRMEELGPRQIEYETQAYNLLAGIGGYVENWDWEAAIGYALVDAKLRGVNGYAEYEDLQAAVDDGTLNLFGDSPDFDAASLSHTVKRDAESKHYFADVKATGEIYELSAGSVQMAVGAEIRREEYKDKFDEVTESGALLGVGGTSGEGDRNIQSAYAELSVPTSEDLELQIAGRYDHYSDFGGTFNPKIGLRWQPRGDFLLRTSAGTGFKAPSLNELYSGESVGFETLEGEETKVTSIGNPELDPEKSNSFNLGFVWDITNRWDLGIDYWYLRNKDAVVRVSAQDILDNEVIFPNLITRDTVTGDLISVESTYENIAAQQLWGIDLNSHIAWNTGELGNYHFAIMASYLGNYKEESIEGAGFEDLAGRDGRPRVRSQATLGWDKSVYSSSLTVNYISGYERPNEDFPEYDRIESWTTVDAQFNWSPQTLSGGTITIGAKNLFDEEPPADPVFEYWPFINRALHNPRGRFIYLGYRHKF